MLPITVIKRNPAGQETWRYVGQVLRREPTRLTLEARFNRPDTPFYDVILCRGDRFVETYYTDRWYNIYEVHDRDDDRLKVWYCNVGYPAEITAEAGGLVLSYIDLALDLLVYPDGRQVILDEDEFAALPLSAEIRTRARAALAELQALFVGDGLPKL